MDKPTPPKPFTYVKRAATELPLVFLSEAIEHGNAMAAWGAAQEREKAADLLLSAEAEPYATASLVNARRLYRQHLNSYTGSHAGFLESIRPTEPPAQQGD